MAETKQQGKYRAKTYLKTYAELIDKAAGTGLVPPQCIEIEQSVLGAMMIDKTACLRVLNVIGMRTIETSPFYREAHTHIYRAIMNLNALNQEVDLRIVYERLKLDGEAAEIGGPAYLVELTGKVVTTANVEAHARLILEKYIARELIRTCEEMKLRAFIGEDDTFDLLDSAEQEIFKLSEVRHHGGQYGKPMASLVASTMEYVENVSDHEKRKEYFIDTPFDSTQRSLGGYGKGELIIIAGRPGSGKSSLASALLRRFPKPSALISLEMKDRDVVLRLCCQAGNASLWHARQGLLDENGKYRLVKGASEVGKLPITIFDDADVKVSDIRRMARRLIAKEKIELLVIDHIHIMTPEDPRISRHDQMGVITSQLKKLAMECNIPVLALAQLNRDVEKREMKRPTLSDLRESGSIEENADIVILLFRPAYYDMEEKFEGEAIFDIAKHRNGAPEEVRLRFRKHSTDFEDPAGPVVGRLAQQELGMLVKPANAETF